MNFEDLSPELREKAFLCKTPEELMRLAEEEGYALTDEQLKEVQGGDEWFCTDYSCPDDDIW